MTELGSHLRMAREEKSLTLDELQKITRIQKRYLVAIEEGNYDILPGKFYARAFIKQYAEAVDLEPEVLFEEHKNEIPPAYEDDLSNQLSRSNSRRRVNPTTAKALELFPKILAAIFGIALLVLIWWIFTNYFDFGGKPAENNSDGSVGIVESDEVTPPVVENNEKTDGATEDEATDEKTLPEDEETVEQKIDAVDVSGSVTTYSVTNADQFKVEIKATTQGRTWVEMKDETGVLFQGELQNGASETFDLTDQTVAYIKTGRSSETEIYVNGEKLTYEQQQIVQNFVIQFEKED